MAEVRPFRGVRFNAQHAGPLGSLIAPPYDVNDRRIAGSEFSISRIENADLAVDGDQHACAAERYTDWLRQGVLVQDAESALYVHRHRFDVDGVSTVRTGMLARVRLADWDERIVLPHERTNPGPREERFDRLRAVGANLSPLYFLYRDPDGAVQNLIDRAAHGTAPAERDRMGGEHWLVPILDDALQSRLNESFRHRSFFVADGHHRYEASLAYRNARRAEQPGVDGGWEYVLALLAPVQDPGVVVKPTHRLLVGGPPVEAQRVEAELRNWFDVRSATVSMPTDVDFLFRLLLPGLARGWDVYARPGAPHVALMPAETSGAWKSLPVSIVQGVIGRLVGSGDAAASIVSPSVDASHAARQVADGHARAAFLLPPPPLERLLDVAEAGDLLPPKSTWFEPKAPAGLVINDLGR